MAFIINSPWYKQNVELVSPTPLRRCKLRSILQSPFKGAGLDYLPRKDHPKNNWSFWKWFSPYLVRSLDPKPIRLDRKSINPSPSLFSPSVFKRFSFPEIESERTKPNVTPGLSVSGNCGYTCRGKTWTSYYMSVPLDLYGTSNGHD